jgi:hypothetical protein
VKVPVLLIALSRAIKFFSSVPVGLSSKQRLDADEVSVSFLPLRFFADSAIIKRYQIRNTD